jgi:hypothetical protein
VFPAQSVFCVAPAWLSHLVECHDAVTRFEFIHAFADLVDYSCDIVALVESTRTPFWPLAVSISHSSQSYRRSAVPGPFQSLGLLPLYTYKALDINKHLG